MKNRQPYRLVLLLAIVMAMSAVFTAQAQDNLLTNPSFEPPFDPVEGVVPGQIAQGWSPWFSDVDGSLQPEYYPASDTISGMGTPRINSGADAQQYFTFFSRHVAGVYQQVTGLAAGNQVEFSIYAWVWSTSEDNPDQSAPDADITVEVGIDPTGGADATSAAIVWSAPITTYDAFTQLSVAATAQGEAVTVFVRSTVGVVLMNNVVYLDDASLTVTGQGEVVEATSEVTDEATVETTDAVVEITETATDAAVEVTEVASVEPTAETPVDVTEAVTEIPTIEIIEVTSEITETATDVPVEVTEPATVEATIEVTDVVTEPTAEVTVEVTEVATETATSEVTPEVTAEVSLVPSATVEPTVVLPTATFTETLIPTLPIVETPTEVLPTVVPPTATLLPTLNLTVFPLSFTYVVQNGDIVADIAQRYNTTVDAIIIANNLNPDAFIVVEQVIVIPVQTLPVATLIPTVVTADPQAVLATPTQIPTNVPPPTLVPTLAAPTVPPTVSAQSVSPTASTFYVVQYGDTLSSIASRFRLTTRDLARANGIVNPNLVYVGQVLIIPTWNVTPTPTRLPPTAVQPTMAPPPTQVPPPTLAPPTLVPPTRVPPTPTPPVTHMYRVAPGDTLYLISIRFNVRISDLIRINHIADANRIFVGQVLYLP